MTESSAAKFSGWTDREIYGLAQDRLKFDDYAGVLAEIAVFLFMPRLLRRWSLRGVLLASFALAVARFLLMGWFPALPAVQGAAQLLHGATFGAYHAAVVAVLNRWFPARQQVRVQAVYGSISFGAGGLLGALMSGLAWETLGAGLTYSLGGVENSEISF